MKSACCKHVIVIQTDPKNCEYVIVSGAQRKTEDFDIKDAETFALPADEGWYFELYGLFLPGVYIASPNCFPKPHLKVHNCRINENDVFSFMCLMLMLTLNLILNSSFCRKR